MNSRDIDKLVRWAVDSDLKTFAEDAYGITGTAYDRTDDYISGKYSMMHENFIMWLGSLDGKNRIRLARNITFAKKECEKCDGKGYAYHDDNIDCDECNGTGNETEGE